ncbi:MAG TPA: replicative DNA helicase [Steroidobacteraceae bacterium]|nr:replicative DNA helicase [Steroidobacteraceae bacterium]
MSTPLRPRREGGSEAEGLTPPHSVEAEQSVLGALLIDATAWDQVADVVSAADFYRPDHRLIFEALAELAAASHPGDVVTVSEQLERRGQLVQAGGLAYLGTLARDTPTAANVRAYATIVRERAMLRRLLEAGRRIAASVFAEQGQSARELVDEAERLVFEIAEQGARGRDGAVRVSALLPPLIDKIDEWHSNPEKLRGLATGFTDFDRLTGGLRPGDLLVIAGRPSMGKTTLAVNIAEFAAVNPEIRASVAIFSMEMPSEQLVTRMLSSIGHVPLNSIRSGRISDDDWVRITGATSQLSEAKIFIDESAGLTPTELRARARRIKREHGLGLVVVDYLQLMQVTGSKENRATEIAEISRSLKALAKELQLPVIALSQLNRGVEQRTEKKPVMSDLRECVTGETRVCLADGRRVPIVELVGTQPQVWAFDAASRLHAARADCVWRVGRRPVLRVTLAGGRSVRATAQHRLLAGEGWKRVAELVAGERLAVARRLPAPAAPVAQVAHARLHDTVDVGGVQALGEASLPALTENDIFWDRVTAVTADGEEDVYDLTVPGPANWLADAVVSHNSGAIEQDSDMILLIYRDEVYDKNTTKKGIAEIDLAKHRNGETGTFLLTFQGQYTRFVNWAPDAYAEGVLR